MAVLSKNRILERLQRSVTEAGSLVITPFLKMDEAFDSDSIDLRLGFYFLLPKTPPELFFDPSSRISEALYTRVHVPTNGHLVIPAHQTVLGAHFLHSTVLRWVWTASFIGVGVLVVGSRYWRPVTLFVRHFRTEAFEL